LSFTVVVRRHAESSQTQSCGQWSQRATAASSPKKKTGAQPAASARGSGTQRLTAGALVAHAAQAGRETLGGLTNALGDDDLFCLLCQAGPKDVDWAQSTNNIASGPACKKCKSLHLTVSPTSEFENFAETYGHDKDDVERAVDIMDGKHGARTWHAGTVVKENKFSFSVERAGTFLTRAECKRKFGAFPENLSTPLPQVSIPCDEDQQSYKALKGIFLLGILWPEFRIIRFKHDIDLVSKDSVMPESSHCFLQQPGNTINHLLGASSTAMVDNDDGKSVKIDLWNLLNKKAPSYFITC
jgi:hypothetical protein